MTPRLDTTFPAAADTQVRIGDLRVASDAGARLVTVGLGSCIGVALIDEVSGAVGLAHVFLPAPPPSGAKPNAGAGTYAQTAIPALVDQVARSTRGPRSSSARRMVAVIAGGARMFASRPGTVDVGERNIAAVRDALRAEGITIAAEDIGGSNGRTMRVTAGAPGASVTVRTVGSDERQLWNNTMEGKAAQAA